MGNTHSHPIGLVISSFIVITTYKVLDHFLVVFGPLIIIFVVYKNITDSAYVSSYLLFLPRVTVSKSQGD